MKLIQSTHPVPAPTTRLPAAKLLTHSVAAGCALGYAHLAYLSHLPGGVGVVSLVAHHGFIAALVFGYFGYLQVRGRELGFAAVVAWAVVFRLIGSAAVPLLEDDYFRYLLDGCVFVTTGQPYGVSPEAMFLENPLPQSCQYLLNRVNYPHLPTIYAPVLQYLFAAVYLLAGAKITALQVALSLVDLCLIGLLCRYAPPRYVLLYAWCPLVVKEIAFTAHPDVVGAVLLLWALHWRAYGRYSWAVVAVALACATKIFALVLLPFVLWRLSVRYWLLGAAVMLALYLPFVVQGATDLGVLGIFIRHWQFNSVVFMPLAQILGWLPARLLCLTAFCVFYGWYFDRWRKYSAQFPLNPRSPTFPQSRLVIHGAFPRGDWIFGVFLLLSPVVNAWYALWLLPFAALRPSFWAWGLAAVLPFSYFFGLNYPDAGLRLGQVAPWAQIVQASVIAVGLGVDGWLRRRVG